MKGVVCLHDKTTHGGMVIRATGSMLFGQFANARQGDWVSCPIHGENTIVEGDASWLDESVPVVVDGCRCACGCRVISSHPDSAAG